MLVHPARTERGVRSPYGDQLLNVNRKTEEKDLRKY